MVSDPTLSHLVLKKGKLFRYLMNINYFNVCFNDFAAIAVTSLAVHFG
jgi:hypothetical protein